MLGLFFGMIGLLFAVVVVDKKAVLLFIFSFVVVVLFEATALGLSSAWISSSKSLSFSVYE